MDYWTLQYIDIDDVSEPAIAMPPEIYAKTNDGSGWERTNLYYITEPGEYSEERVLEYWPGGAPYSSAKLEFWEDDGWGTGSDDKLGDWWNYYDNHNWEEYFHWIPVTPNVQYTLYEYSYYIYKIRIKNKRYQN